MIRLRPLEWLIQSDVESLVKRQRDPPLRAVCAKINGFHGGVDGDILMHLSSYPQGVLANCREFLVSHKSRQFYFSASLKEK